MNFSTRKAEQIKKVMLNPEAKIPRSTYYMLRNIPFLSKDNKRFDLTIIPAFKLGKEFNKTFGHIHKENEPETYKLLLGKALFLLQKMEISQSAGQLDSESAENVKEGSERMAKDKKERANVTDIQIIRVNRGDTVKIPSGWYHETINIGRLPLVLVNWIPEHTENDYSIIEEMQGFGYYVVDNEPNTYKLIKNDKYNYVPEPKLT